MLAEIRAFRYANPERKSETKRQRVHLWAELCAHRRRNASPRRFLCLSPVSIFLVSERPFFCPQWISSARCREVIRQHSVAGGESLKPSPDAPPACPRHGGVLGFCELMQGRFPPGRLAPNYHHLAGLPPWACVCACVH